ILARAVLKQRPFGPAAGDHLGAVTRSTLFSFCCGTMHSLSYAFFIPLSLVASFGTTSLVRLLVPHAAFLQSCGVSLEGPSLGPDLYEAMCREDVPCDLRDELEAIAAPSNAEGRS